MGDQKETAKDMTEEGITGAFIRDLKGNTRTVCFVTGSGEHQIDDTSATAIPASKTCWPGEYQTKSIDLFQKAEVPPTAPRSSSPARRNYEQPEVDAIKNYVEGGGRAFFMLDPPFSSALPPSPRTMRSPLCSQAGASPWTRISSST